MHPKYSIFRMPTIEEGWRRKYSLLLPGTRLCWPLWHVQLTESVVDVLWFSCACYVRAGT